MITLREVEDAICEMEAVPDANFETCRKLAVFYILRDYMGGGLPSLGYSAADSPREKIGNHGDTEFLGIVAGRDPDGVWSVLDELMETLRITNPRLYDGVMRRLDAVE